MSNLIEYAVNAGKARDGVMSVLGNHDYTYYMDVDDEQEIAALEKRDRKSTRLNSSHVSQSRMPSSA